MAVLAGGAVRPSRFRYWRQWLTAYLFIAPWLIFPLVFIAGAIVLAIYFSFTSYDLLSDPVWIGLENYKKAWSDQTFIHALRNVATYTTEEKICVSCKPSVWECRSEILTKFGSPPPPPPHGSLLFPLSLV